MSRLTNKKTSDYIHNKLEDIRHRMKDTSVSASMNPAYEEMAYIETYEQDELRYEKLGILEDAEERVGCSLEKVAKAFEIIKEKGIDLYEFRLHRKAFTYNLCIRRGYCKDLTDEEFDCLKEVLK